MVLEACMVNVLPIDDGSMACSMTDHEPSPAAVPLTVWPLKETMTASPGEAVPQILTGFWRCRTMLLLKILLGTTVAVTRWTIMQMENIMAAVIVVFNVPPEKCLLAEQVLFLTA